MCRRWSTGRAVHANKPHAECVAAVWRIAEQMAYAARARCTRDHTRARRLVWVGLVDWVFWREDEGLCLIHAWQSIDRGACAATDVCTACEGVYPWIAWTRASQYSRLEVMIRTCCGMLSVTIIEETTSYSCCCAEQTEDESKDKAHIRMLILSLGTRAGAIQLETEFDDSKLGTNLLRRTSDGSTSTAGEVR